MGPWFPVVGQAARALGVAGIDHHTSFGFGAKNVRTREQSLGAALIDFPADNADIADVSPRC